MVTKLTAARIATAAGCCLVICTSAKPEGIVDILGGARQGTRFLPLQRSLKGRKRWLLTGDNSKELLRCLLVLLTDVKPDMSCRVLPVWHAVAPPAQSLHILSAWCDGWSTRHLAAIAI
jgi:hypothetical protein